MTTDTRKLVTFRLADAYFAADIFAVERVLRYQAPRPLPDVPSWVEGVIEYQSRVVPVINLRRRFELPAREPTGETRIVVLNSRGEWVGIVVDAVLEVSPVETSKISEPPSFFAGLAGEYMNGIVRRGGENDTEKLVVIVNVEKLLSASERIALDVSEARAGTPATVPAGNG